MRTSFHRVSAAAAALVLSLAIGHAKIERLTLAQMVQRADDCVVGRIVESAVFRVDHPIDGAELYFTRLTIEGRSLYAGSAISVPVTFAGGMLPGGEGVWNSDAPSAAETRVANEVVVFYKWTDNMGGGVAANALYCAHGGLYRVVRTRKGDFVLGRGEGYAIDGNAKLVDLEQQVARLR